MFCFDKIVDFYCDKKLNVKIGAKAHCIYKYIYRYIHKIKVHRYKAMFHTIYTTINLNKRIYFIELGMRLLHMGLEFYSQGN
jgi:hypothetical protein